MNNFDNKELCSNQQLLDGIALPIYMSDINGHMIAANSTLLSLFRLSYEQITETGIHTLIHGESHSDLSDTDKIVAEDGGKFVLPGCIEVSGENLPVLIAKSPLLDDSGVICGVVTTLQEQSRFNKIKTALDQSESQKQAILDGYPGVLALFNSNKELTWANNGMERYAPDSIGKKFGQIFQPVDGDCPGLSVLKNALEGRRDVIIQQVVSDKEDENYFEFIGSPVIEGDGTVNDAIMICRDVTDKFKLEKQLRYAQKMEAIGTLAGGIAHDFNNVLTPIMGYSEIVKLKLNQLAPDDADVKEYLDEILRAARRAKALVEQILTFSRSSEQKDSLQYLHPIIKEVMKLMRVTLPSTIKITQDIDEQCGMVSVDPVQIHQVLINLCTNSSHAMEGGKGEMVVKLKPMAEPREGKSWLVLSVSDDGCGIEPSMVDRIFEPYFTTKEKERGTGMGLAMVHGIVSRQGGYAEVESNVGVGTVFRVYLPVARQSTTLEKIVSTDEFVGGDERILLVDDDTQVVEVTSELLQNLGYEVKGTSSPSEALDIISQGTEEFSLLITDLIMPDLTGLELAGAVSKINPDLPIILFTGYSDQFSNVDAVEAGVNAYCVKPVSLRDIARIVRGVIIEGYSNL